MWSMPWGLWGPRSPQQGLGDGEVTQSGEFEPFPLLLMPPDLERALALESERPGFYTWLLPNK